MNIYSFYPEEDDKHGVAYAPQAVTWQLLYRKGKVNAWKSVEFSLKDGGFADYQSDNLGWHLCSDKLKSILAECAGHDDEIQWLPVVVKDPAGERRNYYALHLASPCDVLSSDRTIFSGDRVVKPVLDASKIGAHSIFTFSNSGVYVYVTEQVRKRVQEARLTGLKFLKVPVLSP
jgi:hypothetical protein